MAVIPEANDFPSYDEAYTPTDKPVQSDFPSYDEATPVVATPQTDDFPSYDEALGVEQRATPETPRKIGVDLGVEPLPSQPVDATKPIGAAEAIALREEARTGVPPTPLSTIAKTASFGLAGVGEKIQETALADLARGKKSVIGEAPVPLDQLSDFNLKATATFAGLSMPFVNDALDDWDKTTGKRFQNDEARKKARSLFVQGLAGEVLRERLQNKVDAGEQLNQRDRTLWAKLVAPAIRNTEEIMRFMAGAPTAVAIGAGQRFGELTQPKRELQDGQVVETAEGDTARKALAKSIIGAGVEYAIERRGGKLLNAGIGKVFRALPGGKALLGSISKMPVVGQAVDTFGKLARITGQQGLAGEVFEEGLQALADEGVGFAVRGAEKTTPISQRMAVAARTFAQPENMKDLVLGMLLTQAAQGGAAETMAWQRQATQGRNLDGILTAFGADGKTLRVMTPEDKQNAYAAIQQQLTPEKAQAVLQRMGGRAADAYNQIAEAKGFGFATTADPKERFIKKLEYVQDTAKRLAGDVPVIAYATEADLLAAYPEIALAKDYQANAICGTFYDGKTHVVLDKMHTPRDIVSTILHESGVHASLAKMTPANKERILRGIGKNAMKQASEISQTLGVGDVPSAEEALALIGEQRVVKPSAYQRGVNALRNQIRAVYPSLKLNNSDLAVIVGDAQKAVRGEGGTFELMATVAPEAEQATTTAPGVASETPVGETQTPLTPTNETQAIPPTAQVQELAPEPTPTVAQPTAANVVTPSALPAERVEQLPKNVQVPASIAQQAIIQEPVALNVVGQPAPISSAVSKRAQTSPVVPKVDTDVRERERPLSSKEEKIRNSLISKARSFGRKKQYALMNKSLARADALRSTAFTRSALDKVNRARIARGKKPIIGMTQLQRPPPDNVALKREFIAERGLTRERVVAMSPAEHTAMEDEFKAWWRKRTDNPLSSLSPDQKAKEERAYKDTGIRFRKATREPQNTITAYKLFRVDERFPGKLFPLFVNATQPVDVGVWMDAESGPMKDGKVKSRLGGLAYRPGWHSSDLPLATHIGSNPDVKNKPTTRPANQVWTEVELPADRDWQAEANKRGTNAAGKLIPVKAQITDQIPVDGFYRYKTNSNMTGNWLISGAIKVNRVLSDEEVRAINGRVGTADLPRQQPFDFVKYGFDKTAREAGAQPQLRRAVVTPEQDATYMAAVERGDTETAQRMVDAVAKVAGLTGTLYHGTDGATFTRFKKTDDVGFFFTSSKKVARSYAPAANWTNDPESDLLPFLDPVPADNNRIGPTSGIYHVFLDIKNPLVIDAAGEEWNRVPVQKRQLNIEALEVLPSYDENGSVDHKASVQIFVTERVKKDGPVELLDDTDAKEILDTFVFNDSWVSDTEAEQAETINYSFKLPSVEAYNQFIAERYSARAIINASRIANAEEALKKTPGLNRNYARINVASGANPKVNTRTAVRLALSQGKDAVIFKRILDVGPDSFADRSEVSDVYVVFDPQQIYFANAVARDEAGNAIPLSQRFNAATPDIRFRRTATPAEDYQRDLRDAGLADRYVQVPKGETKEVRKAQLLRNLLYADGLDREGRDGLVRKAEGELAQRKTEMALDAASGAFNTDRSVDSARMVAVMNATMLDAVKPDASVETMDLADEVNLKAQEKFTRLGRALAFLRDRFNTPEGRRAELARILMMPDDVVAEKLKIAKTEAERREIRRPIIAKARERLKDLRKVQVIDADGKRTPLDINAFTNDQLMNDALFKDAVSKIIQQRASVGDKLYEFWQNSILSGPVTLLFVNPLGNAANIALELGPQRQAEILIGKALRSKDAPTTASTAAGFRYANEAMPDAWKNARITFTTEQSQLGEYANKWDTGNQAIGRKVFGLDLGFDVGKAVRSPRNWLSATDQGFRTWLMNFHVADLATRAFDNANKEVGTTPTEIERDAFIREAMKDDSEFYAQAQEIASRELFQTKPGLLGQMFLSARHSDNPIARTLSRYLLPFVTTPANVIKTGARKTPFGTIPLVWNFVRGKYKGTEAGKAEGVRLAAEQAVGWGVLMAVASLMEGDDDDPLKRPRITGTQQVSGRYRPGEREYEKRNEPPMSVRIGDNWFSYRRLEPVATILATIVDMLNAGKSAQAGDWSKAGQRIANSLVGMFSDRTYLKTVGDIIDAVRDNNPGSYMKIATGTAAGFVPNIAKTTMRGFDPVIHDIRNRSPKGTFEWLETSGKRLAQMALPSPAVIKQPVARYDVYGRPLTKAGGAAENILSPFTRQRADKMTKIDAMLKRYADKTGETNMLPAPPQVPEVKLFGKPEPVPLTDEEFAEYQRLAGQSAMKRLSAMTFRDYDNPTKYDVARVKKAFESTRKIARIQITNKVRQRIKRERGMAP